MKKRVGILTSGGDCPGLNATIRGVAKALYARMGDNVEIIGILNGYSGLINGDYKEMCEDDFRGILTLGGTILGTKRTPFKLMRVVEDDNIDKVAAMKKTYKAAKLDCLLCLGGNGTHKTANLLSQEGLNIIGLPKTIDNDIYGTDVTFGFHTAVDIATDVIDRIHTTAGSHSRVMCIEIMGNKAGWLTLYSGIAGGADIILLPELPGPAAFLYKVFTCCAAVAAAYGVPGLRNFVQLCVWYLLLNLLLCGAVLLPGVQSANLCVYLPLSPGRLLLCCGAVLAVLRGVLFCFGRAGTRCIAAVLELEGAVLSVQAFCDTGFSVQDPLTGQAVVLVYYPAVRSALPQELRTFLDRYFACGTAPPPELRVRLVPCTTIAGHCVLPAVPAKALRTSKGSAAGILAAFCRPETQQPWTALLGSELAVQLGIR